MALLESRFHLHFSCHNTLITFPCSTVLPVEDLKMKTSYQTFMLPVKAVSFSHIILIAKNGSILVGFIPSESLD